MRTRRFHARMLGGLLAAAAALTGLMAFGPSGAAEAATTVRVMPLGDSITGSPGCWRQILWQRLQDNGYTGVDFVGSLNNSNDCGVAYDGDNEGHGGYLATNILNQNLLPGWLSSAAPDVVIMHLGTNDLWSAVSTSSLLSTFGGLVDQMRTANPSMRIVVAQILPMNPSGCTGCAQRVIDFNAAVPAWAAGKSTSASPVTVVDQWTGFSTDTDTYDGVHPNASGNQKISNRWYPALTSAVDSVGGGTPTSTTTSTTRTTSTTTSTTSTTSTTTSSGRTCTAALTIGSSWPGGFIGTVKVTAGTQPLTSWSVALTIPAGNSIPNLWGGQLTGTTVTNAAWNGTLTAGASAEFGFQASGTTTGWAAGPCTAA